MTDINLKVENKREKKKIDYSVINQGPMYLDAKYKKPGFQYCFVSNKAGEIEMYQRWGYEVVKKDDCEVGQDTVSRSSPFGSAITIQSKCGQLLVLMAICDELYQDLQDFRAEQVRETERSLGFVDGIDAHLQTGQLTINGKKF